MIAKGKFKEFSNPTPAGIFHRMSPKQIVSSLSDKLGVVIFDSSQPIN